VERSEADFDPAAKYHIASHALRAVFPGPDSSVPSSIARCARRRESKARLHRCSIYQNKAAGERLNKMLSNGQSQPWPDALAAITDSGQRTPTAIVDYFAPLKKWLDEQNRVRSRAGGHG